MSFIPEKQSIAVVGLGVAGLTSALMLDEKHEVTLFEKNHYLGGHTNTITIDNGPDARTRVDTGFIVYNDQNYPTFIRLLKLLGIEGRDSDMSFGFHREVDGFAYSSYVPKGLFADRLNLFKPSFLKMIADILNFNKQSLRDLEENKLSNLTLGAYLDQGNYGREFLNSYLIPMGAAIWSTPPGEMLDFPAETFLCFFKNHGLLALKGRPRWRSIPGGSKSYVEAIERKFKGVVKTNTTVQKIVREGEKVKVISEEGEALTYDYVIMGAHADQALSLLEAPTEDEKRLLGAWKYTQNPTVLHTDVSVMPKNKRAWASWNYTLEAGADEQNVVSLTYDMNRLQGLETEQTYLVTLNRKKEIPKEKTIREINYTHPSYNFDSVKTQEELQKLNGASRIFFCGSYFGYGFHEDAVKSATKVLEHFGCSL